MSEPETDPDEPTPETPENEDGEENESVVPPEDEE